MKLYIQQGAKLISNQLGCLYRHLGPNSDGAASFLTCTSLISQQILVKLVHYIETFSMSGFAVFPPGLFHGMSLEIWSIKSA